MAARSLVSALAAVLLAAGAQQPVAPAQDRSAQTGTQRADERIRALQRESDQLASQEKTILVELRKLEVDRQLKNEQLQATERDLRDTQEKLAATVARAATLKDAAETEQPIVAAGLVRLYKLGRVG
jgi:flagellar motility protein MotE (MotC chaperone)